MYLYDFQVIFFFSGQGRFPRGLLVRSKAHVRLSTCKKCLWNLSEVMKLINIVAKSISKPFWDLTWSSWDCEVIERICETLWMLNHCCLPISYVPRSLINLELLRRITKLNEYMQIRSYSAIRDYKSRWIQQYGFLLLI